MRRPLALPAFADAFDLAFPLRCVPVLRLGFSGAATEHKVVKLQGNLLESLKAGVVGKPRAVSLSFGVIQVSDAGWYMRPLPVLNVGNLPDVADQQSLFDGRNRLDAFTVRSITASAISPLKAPVQEEDVVDTVARAESCVALGESCEGCVHIGASESVTDWSDAAIESALALTLACEISTCWGITSLKYAAVTECSLGLVQLKAHKCDSSSPQWKQRVQRDVPQCLNQRICTKQCLSRLGFGACADCLLALALDRRDTCRLGIPPPEIRAPQVPIPGISVPQQLYIPAFVR
ncbi:unnamed protein product [Effrenium voratum]|uniref:Uncharacterized protein n=1 Tax=Effrenium voratum TaxID=2562239 RepID=A0AA36J891_9DINO|nr:unnamed protein product [Effrenium voratum]